VRKDVFDEYNELLDCTSQQDVWTHPGTNTYFRNSRGRLVFVSRFATSSTGPGPGSSSIADYEALEAAQPASATPSRPDHRAASCPPEQSAAREV